MQHGDRLSDASSTPDQKAEIERPTTNLAIVAALSGAASARLDKSRPDKFSLESRLIELGAALMVMQQSFKLLERDFYLAHFGRYDD